MDTDLKSLPTRERGLKWFHGILRGLALKSLPTRERGLKFQIAVCGFKGFRRSLRGSVD